MNKFYPLILNLSTTEETEMTFPTFSMPDKKFLIFEVSIKTALFTFS